MFYISEAGHKPVREYLDSLDPNEARAIIDRLRVLQEGGPGLGMPYVRHLKGKLYELRVSANAQHRVIYVALVGYRLLLLHAFTKKTQKAPAREIELADARYVEFLNREKERRRE